MRYLFRDYLEARRRVYTSLPDWDKAQQQLTRAAELQRQIWTRAIEAGRIDPTQNVVRLLLPALNEMIDVTTSRTVALRTRLPPLVFTLLIGVALGSALLAGDAMSKRPTRHRLHPILYAAAVSITVYTVLDLDNPRAGLIRQDAAEEMLTELADSIR